MNSSLDLEKRAKDGPLNGFTLAAAVHEALGGASVCWDDNGVFIPERALGIGRDLLLAIATFTTIAINQQSLDVRADMADWELAELIFQAPAMGYTMEAGR